MNFLEGLTAAQSAYTDYVKSHIENVQKGYEYFKENLPEYIDDLEIPEEEMDQQIKEHDKSKYSNEEFDAYAEHFNGKNKGKSEEEDPEYAAAWKHHYTNNPHHPEYWGKEKDMPLSCIIEMICDWWSFSWKRGDLYEIVEWWREHKPEKSQYLSDETISKVDEIVNRLCDSFQKYPCIKDNTLVEAFESTTLNESLIAVKSIIDVSILKKIDKMIQGSQKILIVRHISPDPDAIFSAKAMYMGIKDKYPKKEVVLGNEKTSEYLSEDDLLIILDLGVQSRICSKVNGKPKTVRIDHHPDDYKADVNLQLTDAGSTCELVTLFLDECGYKITKEMAEGLFKGIIADTGRMQYSISQTTLAAISILRDLDIDYKKIYNQMYVKDESVIKAKAYILENYRRTPSGVAYLFLDKKRCAQAGIDMQKTAEMVYELAEIRDCPIWVILRENSHGEINLRVRSRTVSISQIAHLFGGGGHDNAAGIKVKSREEAKKVLTKLDDYLKEMKIKNPNLK